MRDTVRDVSSPRIGLSGLLAIGGGVLLVAIAIGNSMGNRVLSAAGGSSGGLLRSVTATAVPVESRAASEVNWKKIQVMSVATDPAFPDPRITPEPPSQAAAKPFSAVRPATRKNTPPPLATPPAVSAPDTPYPGPEAVASAAAAAHDKGP
jgi:hypothetical protein